MARPAERVARVDTEQIDGEVGYSTDKKVLSFCAAWLSAVAYHRELIPPESFKRVSVGPMITYALLAPQESRFSLTHRGLYAFLTQDAKHILCGRRNVAVRVSLSKGGIVHESYEMRCLKKEGAAGTNSVGSTVEHVLKGVSTLAQAHAEAGFAASVEVGFEKVEELRRIPAGAVDVGAWEIHCALFLADV